MSPIKDPPVAPGIFRELPATCDTVTLLGGTLAPGASTTEMTMRSTSASLLLALLALSACGKARQSASESASAEARCTRCHGGLENQTGAPPNDLRGTSDPSAMPVGAHTAHVQAGALAGAFACTACHPDPRSGSTHLDGKVELALDGFAHDGLPGNGATPDFDKIAGTCSSVYCHGAFRNGNGGNAPVWNRVGQGQAACGSCHGAPPPPPHPGATDCGRCHEGYTATSVNPVTHVNGKLDVVGLSCTSCHGDPSRPKNAAAPPLGTHGEASTSDRAVGAHQAHLAGATLGTPVSCDDCHTVPTSLAHANGTVDLTFGALATAGGTFPASWNGATCSTYCHGATLQAGGSNTAPAWTGGSSQAVCGACHAVPPPSPHPAVSSDLTLCAACHPQTMTSAGALIPASAGGKHLDGVVESSGHDASWMDTSSPGFHAYAADADLASCTTCHGAQLDGGNVQVACGRCHNLVPTPVADWRQNCVMCHGGTDNPTGAPPRTTWGRSGDAVRVGAHSTHVSGSDIAPAFDCSVCHVKPDSALSPGHVDGPTATVTFNGLATNGSLVPPSWDRASGTCASTYCHGATLGGGTNKAPVWTSVGTGEASCGSCHGVPPPAPHPAVTGLTSCAGCHPDTVDATGRIIPPSSGGKHLDGVLEVSGGHPASWMDPTSAGFHAYSADAGLASCQACHGPQLDRFPSGNCANASCHGGNLPAGVTSWWQNCTMCHGDPSRAINAAAPPRTIYGMGSDPVRVGAHAAHLAGGPMAPPFGCDVCHVVPADAFSAGHIDQPTATLTFGGLALPSGAATPSWNRSTATCSSTYCHGATLGGGANTAPVWTGGSAQAVCGSCHGLPPPAPHPSGCVDPTSCGNCHGGTVAPDGSLIPPASGGKHLNGVVDAGSLAAGCASCHGSPPQDGGSSGHAFHTQIRQVACSTCHNGYTRTTVDPTTHMNCVRDSSIVYAVPNPDPAGAPPTLDACNAPVQAIATMPQSSSPTVWDTSICTTCHSAQSYLYDRCCGTNGPGPAWCATYY